MPGDITANGTVIAGYSGAHGALTADEVTVSLRLLVGSL